MSRPHPSRPPRLPGGPGPAPQPPAAAPAALSARAPIPRRRIPPSSVIAEPFELAAELGCRGVARRRDPAPAPASRSLRGSRARRVGSRAAGAEARAGVRARPPPATAHRTAARRSVPRTARCRASRYPSAGTPARPRPAPGWRTGPTRGSPPTSSPPTSLAARAIPKSATRASPSSPIRMFAGLMSRWTMPCSWANWRARAVSMPTRTANPIASAPSRAMTSRRSEPSTRLITMKSPLASSTPVSWIVTMFGWRRAAAFRASRRKRSTNASSSANAGRSTLTATSRANISSRARYTTAMPPWPMTSSRR